MPHPAYRTRLVIGKLEDPSIDEDDMPDAIKETLNELLVIPPGVRCPFRAHTETQC